MKKTLLTLCCFSALTLNAQTPTFDWAINIGSTNFDKGYDIATDAAGNVYEIGILAGTADFDPEQALLILLLMEMMTYSLLNTALPEICYGRII